MEGYQKYYREFAHEFASCHSDRERKKLYRELVKKYHPDSNPNADMEIIKAVNDAFCHTESSQTKNGSYQEQRTATHSTSQTSDCAPRSCRTQFQNEAEVDAEIRYFEQKKAEYQNQYWHYHSSYSKSNERLYRVQELHRQTLSNCSRCEDLLSTLEQKLKRSLIPTILLPIYDVYQYGKKHYPKLTRMASFATASCIGFSTIVNPFSMLLNTSIFTATGFALEWVLGLFHQSVRNRYQNTQVDLKDAEHQYFYHLKKINLFSLEINNCIRRCNFEKSQMEQVAGWIHECNRNLTFLNFKKRSFHPATDTNQKKDQKEYEDVSQSSSRSKVYQKTNPAKGD